MEALNEAPHQRQRIRNEEDAGALRRAVGAIARGHVDQAQLVATELATNILRHGAAEGHVLFRPIDGGIELIAVDRGPGFHGFDSASALLGGSPPAVAPRPGRGLGAGLRTIRALASTLDIYSAEGAGTTVLARITGGTPDVEGSFRWGAVNIPVGGEGVSGDCWAVHGDGVLSALVVDGLGHGPAAYEAARAALRTFREDPLAPPAEFLRHVHNDMLATRGGVIGRCTIDPFRDRLTFLAVGNVSARTRHEGGEHRLLGREGVVGASRPAPNAAPTEEPWTPGSTLLMASDGLDGHWGFSDYPGLVGRHPSVVAATIERDHGRDRDDVTVLVVQDRRPALARFAG